MAICEHHPESAKIECPDMTKKQFHDFSATSEKGLPNRKSAKPRRKRPVHYPEVKG